MVAAQLVVWSLPEQDMRGSIPVMDHFNVEALLKTNCIEVDVIKLFFEEI